MNSKTVYGCLWLHQPHIPSLYGMWSAYVRKETAARTWRVMLVALLSDILGSLSFFWDFLKPICFFLTAATAWIFLSWYQNFKRFVSDIWHKTKWNHWRFATHTYNELAVTDNIQRIVCHEKFNSYYSSEEVANSKDSAMCRAGPSSSKLDS